jgi:hypothetical protein
MTFGDVIVFAIDHPMLVSSTGFFLTGLFCGYVVGRGRRSKIESNPYRRIEPRF